MLDALLAKRLTPCHAQPLAVCSRSRCLTPPRPYERPGTLLSALDYQEGYRGAACVR